MTLIIDDLDGNVNTVRVQHGARVVIVKEPPILVNPNYRLHQVMAKDSVESSILDKPDGAKLEIEKWYTVK